MTVTKHEFYMNEALKEAMKAFDAGEVPVGAVIVYEKKIIARAHNQIKTLRDPTAHAEMIAITQAAGFLRNERLNSCDLYVTIEPCSMCMGASVLARIKNLVYGAKDPKTGAAVLLDLGEGVKQFLDQNPNLVRSNVTMRRDGKLETIVGADGTTVFTEDQLGDPKFVNEHWNEIQTAMKHGRMKVR